MAKIESELELAEILHHVLSGNTLVCSTNAVLELRPETLKAVNVNVAPSVFFAAVVNGIVNVTEIGQCTTYLRG